MTDVSRTPRSSLPVSASLSGATATAAPTPAPTASPSEMTSLMDVQKMVRGYQARGHTQADLDPLGIRQADLARSVKQNLDPKGRRK